MTTPTIIIDTPAGVEPIGNTAVPVVANGPDYIALCQEFLEQGAQERLLASAPYTRRVKTFLNLCGQPTAEETYSLAHEICRLLQVPNADWLSEEDCGDTLLGDLPKKAVGGDTLTDILLNTYVAPVFGDRLFKGTRAGVVSAAIGEAVSKGLFRNHPVLASAWRVKTDEWNSHLAGGWAANLVPILQDDPEALWRGLTSLRLLAGYEGLMEFEITPKVLNAIKPVPIHTLDSFPLHEAAKEGAVTQIQSWFQAQTEKVSDSRQLIQMLNSVSGVLEEELKAFLELIETRHLTPTKEVCVQAGKVFRKLPERARPLFRELERKVPPPEPKIKEKSTEYIATDWIDWCINSYFPYRHWQESTESGNDSLEEMVRSFSEWYLNEYSEVQGDLELGLPYQFAAWLEELKEDDISLILMIDGLPGTFMESVLKVARETGLFIERKEHRFAPLPSVTEISKPLLFSGDWCERSSNYLSLLRTRFETDGLSRKVGYFPTLKEFKKASVLEKGSIGVLNYLAVDECLHEDLSSHGIEHLAAIRLRVETLFREAAAILAKSEGDPNRKRIYLCTDHGATRPIPSELTDWESSVMQKVFPEEKYRFGTLDQGRESLIPENLWRLGHRFKCPFSDQSKTYFIPRGHATVKGRSKPKGYCHGGATPEEVLVGTAVMSMVPVSIATPVVRLAGANVGIPSLFLRRMTTLRFQVRNPNAESLELTECIAKEVPDSVREIESRKIPGHSSGEVAVTFYFKEDAHSLNNLVLEFRGLLGENPIHFVFQTQITFRSAQKGGINLKEL